MCHWLYKRCTKCGCIPYTHPINCGKGTINHSHFGTKIDCPESNALDKENIVYRDGVCALHCYLPVEATGEKDLKKGPVDVEHLLGVDETGKEELGKGKMLS